MSGPPEMAMERWDHGWQWKGACRGEDSGLFFRPSEIEPKSEREARERRAKEICATCRVRIECVEYALATREPHGIWGGLNELERRLVLKERDKGLRATG